MLGPENVLRMKYLWFTIQFKYNVKCDRPVYCLLNRFGYMYLRSNNRMMMPRLKYKSFPFMLLKYKNFLFMQKKILNANNGDSQSYSIECWTLGKTCWSRSSVDILSLSFTFIVCTFCWSLICLKIPCHIFNVDVTTTSSGNCSVICPLKLLENVIYYCAYCHEIIRLKWYENRDF